MLVVGRTPAIVRAVGDLEEMLSEASGLSVEVEPVTDYGDIIDAMCGDEPVVGWLDGFAYMAAEQRGCAFPDLIIVHGRGREADRGYSSQLIINTRSSLGDIEEVVGLVQADFCRLDSQDAVSWVIPALMMRAAGIEPFTELMSVTDEADLAWEEEPGLTGYRALVMAVYEGLCEVAGIPPGTIENMSDLPDDFDGVVRVLKESVEIPYAVLAYPPTVTGIGRRALTNAFVDLISGDGADIITTLLGGDSFERVDEGDFDELREFLTLARFDPVLMGQ